jgi:hypothetical protein
MSLVPAEKFQLLNHVRYKNYFNPQAASQKKKNQKNPKKIYPLETPFLLCYTARGFLKFEFWV